MREKKVKNLDMKQYGMVVALIAVFLIFSFLTKGANMTPMNMNNLIMQNGYVVILAVGMLLCVLTGNIDLGVGSMVALSGAVIGILLVDYKVNIWIAILAAILVGLLSGVFVGFFVSKLGIPPFIVTLATMLMGRGLTYTVLQAQTKGPFPNEFTYIGAGFLPTIKVNLGGRPIDVISVGVAIIISVLILLAEFKDIKTKEKYGFATNPLWQIAIKEIVILAIVWFIFSKLATCNGIPFVLVIMAVLAGFYHYITTKTVAGRQIYALGGNAKAAKLSGINTEKVFFWVYTNMGIMCAIAGIVLSARNGSSTPKAGDGFEMDAIASCYIGGAATAGGVGTVIGAVVGAFIMGILNNGMSLYGWSTDIQKIVKGAVLLGAVTVDLVTKRKKG
ncbi:multiple monosaccharide ABC transporter permease [Anaerosacchariphilus polymeriproducens]|uniref:Xylose transport system permease protein XylH n=1 Tax=Anaerosacchariphilus polymeriproducens TaxID=1812858 RepID=A0A371AST1_9FIRM|nr:multiple monosaccharide ABC transporter permease [Anaerosacchariphilus polymeriproducens]RDU22621.1 sugar ABC transporter permease [Anaerosacchariphilus polymeriproducens]